MIRTFSLTWLAMTPVAILNGIFREVAIVPLVGDFRAHQLSVLTGTAALFGVAWVMLRRDVADLPDRRLLGIGAAWTAATIAFEFGFGHYVEGIAWSALLADYDVAEGRLWPVVLLALAAIPLLVKRLDARLARHSGDAAPIGHDGHGHARRPA